jgi:hypothetical protein
MKTGITTILALLVILAITTMVNSQTMMKDSIYMVVIYVDGLSSQNLASNALESNLMTEEGVAKANIDAKNGVILVTAKTDGRQINLSNLVNRINETRDRSTGYIFRKMKVYAVGNLVKSPVEYYTTAKQANMRDRYKLMVGDVSIIFAENKKLDDLVKSGLSRAVVSGVVTAFSNAMPIMVVGEFMAPGNESIPKLIPTPKESISSVKIYVDGFNDQNLSPEALKANIMTEEGVAKIVIDKKNGTVIITPKKDGKQVSLYNLSKRVNETRQKETKYNVILMKVSAIGRLVNPPGETSETSETEETSRVQENHKLQIGDIFFNLVENEKLAEMVNSGFNEIEIEGTVVRYNNTIPVVEIDSFDTATGESLAESSLEPLDEFYGKFEKEKQLMMGKKHSHIDSVRFYVDRAIEPDFADSVKIDMSQEPSVLSIAIDSKLGLVEIMPKDGVSFDIYSIWHHIDMVKGYKIIKADVVASGEVIEAGGGYQANIVRQQYYKQYKLAAGNFTGFILAPSQTLNNLLDSKSNLVTVVGTVTNFKERMPILDVKYFQKLEQKPDWLK